MMKYLVSYFLMISLFSSALSPVLSPGYASSADPAASISTSFYLNDMLKNPLAPLNSYPSFGPSEREKERLKICQEVAKNSEVSWESWIPHVFKTTLGAYKNHYWDQMTWKNALRGPGFAVWVANVIFFTMSNIINHAPPWAMRKLRTDQVYDNEYGRHNNEIFYCDSDNYKKKLEGAENSFETQLNGEIKDAEKNQNEYVNALGSSADRATLSEEIRKLKEKIKYLEEKKARLIKKTAKLITISDAFSENMPLIEPMWKICRVVEFLPYLMNIGIGGDDPLYPSSFFPLQTFGECFSFGSQFFVSKFIESLLFRRAPSSRSFGGFAQPQSTLLELTHVKPLLRGYDFDGTIKNFLLSTAVFGLKKELYDFYRSPYDKNLLNFLPLSFCFLKILLSYGVGVFSQWTKICLREPLPGSKGWGLGSKGWGELAANALLKFYDIKPYTPQGIFLGAVLEATFISIGNFIGKLGSDLFFNIFTLNPGTHPTVQGAHQQRAQGFTDLEKHDLLEGVRTEDPRALKLIEVYNINSLELASWKLRQEENKKNGKIIFSENHLPFYVTEKLALIENLRGQEKSNFIKGLIYKDPQAYQALGSLEVGPQEWQPPLAHLADNVLTIQEKSAILRDENISLIDLEVLLGKDFKAIIQKWVLEVNSPLKAAA